MKSIGRALLGPRRSRATSRDARDHAARLDRQLEAFDSRFQAGLAPEAPRGPLCEEPVFILSAGWRSGSTLLQRMVMANNPSIIVWGEPYDIASPIQTLADQLRPFSAEWPRSGYFVEPRGSNLSNEWVANLYPPAQAFRTAHLAYLETLFAAPAEALGRSHWGLKEVRLGSDHVRYLRWLYPRAKFVFLIRNPLNAYRSYRNRLTWFADWPNKMVATPYSFGRHWRRLCGEFLEMRAQGVGVLLHYESLGDDAAVSGLGDYLGWAVPRLQEMAKLKGWNGDAKSPLGAIEKVMLRRAVGSMAGDLGY
ncbi:sulfotransferase [Pelagibius sp.]|uniref:sulfotransferase n=1 Tax=Pelagibius sp. TaxID=1931238 RepID=UPI003B50C4AA